MIKLRIDVDYPYPSRTKSFLYIALGIKKTAGKDYLRNARALAKMINDSPKEVMAYWFFTPYTIPDKKLLSLLNPQRHEVALHVATTPYREWKILENETERTVKYYTIHGTSNYAAQILWRRKLGQKQAKIPRDFPVKNFHDIPTYSLDTARYIEGYEGSKRQAKEWISQGAVLSVHPEWLFKKGKNRRGPYYDVLKNLLEVDRTLEPLRVVRRRSVLVGFNLDEYEADNFPTDDYIERLCEREIDVYTFLERKWCCPVPNPPSNWIKEPDNVALLEISNYEAWLSDVGKKTRNMIRKAEKEGVKIAVSELDDKFIEGISKIYNETPIRQGRAFSHYNMPLDKVAWNMRLFPNSTFIGAYLGEELVGFIQLIHGDQITVISQILSMQKHWDKSLNNALLAKAVEVCADKGERWLMYGRIGNHPSLDRFKESNGFTKYPISRFYMSLTRKGKLAMKLGLQRELKNSLPDSTKKVLIPIVNWASRTKVKLRRH